MGEWDRKNWLIKAEIKEDLTDVQFLNYLATHQDFTLKDYNRFKKTLVRPLRNDKAEQIVRFFLEYNNGELYPDRYNYFEPIRKVFSEDLLPEVIESLCWPGGSLYFKKLRTYDVDIENEQFAVCFTDGQYIHPVPKPRENLVTITMYFSKTKVKDCSRLFGLVNDLVNALGAVQGEVVDQEDMHVVYECPISK